MTPAHRHMSWHELSTAGRFPTRTVGTPGSHGATVAGTQGMGVNTPSAAAVAAATTGLAGLEHMPNDEIFTIGLWSIMFAAGAPLAMTRLVGKTCNDAGVAPKLHCNTAPFVN